MTSLFAISSSVVMADGIDDKAFYEEALTPDNPNYYRDFDTTPCRYPIGPPGTTCLDANRIEYIPSGICEPELPQPMAVPEPNPEALLVMGLAALLLKTRLKK